MYFLQHAHSSLRWLVLIFLVVAVVNALMKRNSGAEFGKSDKMPALLALIFTHVQLVLGFILYFISNKVNFQEGFMKDPLTRFYSMEHIAMMLIAIVLITIGYSKSKRQTVASKKHTTILIFYGIGLLLILAAIPWPFRAALGGGWF